MTLTIISVAVWAKIAVTVVFLAVGVVLTVVVGLFGPGAMPETGEGSSSWITVVLFVAISIVILWLCGCTANQLTMGYPNKPDPTGQHFFERHPNFPGTAFPAFVEGLKQLD